MTCLIDGCPRPKYARALCAAHYMRLQRYGDPEHYPIADAAQAWIADVEWLLDAGESVQQVAARLDRTLGAVAKRLRRNGRPDLANRFERVNWRQRTAGARVRRAAA